MAETIILELKDSDAESRIWVKRMFDIAKKLNKNIELEI
jgi:hypothetical protein